MHRRTYLASIAGSGISGLTGCISSISSSEPSLDPIAGTWPTYRATARRTGTSGSTTPLNTDSSIAWKHSTEGVVYEPIVTGEQALAGTSAGEVIALTAQTGERNWTWTADAAVNVPSTVAGEHVFIRSRAGVHTVDLNTGDVQWTHSFDTKNDAPPAVLGPAPAYRDSVLYIVTPAGELRAYAATDGEEQWTVSLPEAIRRTPAVGADQIFVSTEAGVVYGIDQNDGTTTWRRQPEDGRTRSEIPVIAEDAVIVATAGRVRAVNKSTGEIRWRTTPQPPASKSSMIKLSGSSSGPPVTTVPAVSADRIVVGVQEHLYTLDLESGSQRRAIPVTSGRETMTAPTIVEDNAYVCIDAELVEVHLHEETTSRVTELPADGSSPAIVDGVAFLGTLSGHVVALR